ncbi:histone H1 [Pedobacter lithocola]|uniref:Histone H1 n=1 Tax=Pedobacter lithocola TaxID=1908239 RepID=A0ABV8PDX6_9SPHI
MENFKKLKELIETAEQDAVKFYEKGNKAAGTRLRNALQQSKTLAQELRAEVTAKKNSGK